MISLDVNNKVLSDNSFLGIVLLDWTHC